MLGSSRFLVHPRMCALEFQDGMALEMASERQPERSVAECILVWLPACATEYWRICTALAVFSVQSGARVSHLLGYVSFSFFPHLFRTIAQPYTRQHLVSPPSHVAESLKEYLRQRIVHLTYRVSTPWSSPSSAILHDYSPAN